LLSCRPLGETHTKKKHMKAPKPESNRVLVPEGQYPARCFLVAFIGHQTVTWQGQEKEQPKLIMTFELPTETHIFKDEKGPEPFSLSKTVTMSMDARGNMRKFIEAWRGKAYKTDDEAWECDFTKFCGHPGLMTVAHDEHNGKVYANISSLVPLPKGLSIPAQVNKSVIYDIRQHTEAKCALLPEWVQTKVKESREYRNYQAPKDEPETMGEQLPADDEIPF